MIETGPPFLPLGDEDQVAGQQQQLVVFAGRRAPAGLPSERLDLHAAPIGPITVTNGSHFHDKYTRA